MAILPQKWFYEVVQNHTELYVPFGKSVPIVFKMCEVLLLLPSFASAFPATVRMFVPLFQIYEHFSNFQDDEKPNSEGKTRDLESQTGVVSEQESPVAQKRSGTPPPLKKAVENNQTSSASEATEEGEDSDQDRDNHEKEVRSILTKDRRMADDSYKAVWFKEDIDPDSKDDVVMIEDDSDAERNGSESDGDGDSGRGGSQASSTPENLLDPGIGPTASQSDRDTEENNDFF